MTGFYVLEEAFEPGVIRLGRRHGRWQVAEGRSHADLLGTEEVGVLFLSDEFAEAIRGYSGWRLGESVTAAASSPRVEKRYRRMVVTSKCGRLSVPTDSVIVRRDHFAEVSGVWFDPDTWSGADIFRPEASEFTLLSERAALAVKAASLDNVLLTPATDLVRTVPVEVIAASD